MLIKPMDISSWALDIIQTETEQKCTTVTCPLRENSFLRLRGQIWPRPVSLC
jgi:hypothetical protein